MAKTVIESMKIGSELKHGEGIIEKLADADLEVKLLANKLGLKESAVIELIASPILYELANLRIRAILE